MQINKKLFSSAIIALLVLSVVAVAAPAFALTGGATNVTTTTTFIDPSTPGTAAASVTVGQKVVISGTDAAAFNSINVYWETVSEATLLGTTSAGAPPNQANPTWFNVTVTIPTAINGVHNIIVSDGTANIGKTVTVVAKVSAGIGTVRAMPGETVTLTGTGYAPLSIISFAWSGTGTFIAPIVTTDSTGSFTATMVVPADETLSAGAKIVTVTDAVGGADHTSSANIYVSHYITVTPSGLLAPVPPGVTVTISGRITFSTPYSITIDGVTVGSGTSGVDGRFSLTYTLPSLMATGAHAVVVVAPTLTPASPTATLTTGPAPQIQIWNYANSLQLTGGVAGTTVRVRTTANAYNALAKITLSFGTTVVNSTDTDSRFGPTTALGQVNAEFAIPNLSPGVYTVTLADQYGALASITFTINAAASTTIMLNGASYSKGDTLSFTITSTDQNFANARLQIKDPSGMYWFGNPAAPIQLTILALPDGSFIVPYTLQLDMLFGSHFTLPADAPTGSWNWTIMYTNSIGANQIATGLFTVTDSTGTDLSAIIAKLDAINGTVVTISTNVGTVQTDITSLKATITSISGSIATLSTSMGTVTASVNSLSASISSINSGVATVNTKVGTIQTSLDSIDSVIGYIAGDTATISTSLGTVTTSLSSINPTLTSIQNGIATITTDVGTLKGTVTSVSNGVATVQTGVGTLQTNVGNLQTDITSAKDNTSGLSTLVIVAIVLALVAAIAAIASIFLMRQKIAG